MTGRTLAIIPARGGSKRIPRKNVRTVGGKPLIAHTIEQAKAAEQVDTTIVSTDDHEIKTTAKNYGGRVPFDRPAELATDTTPMNDVVSHALHWLAERGETFDTVCLLQVTSPLREPDDINGALEMLREKSAESVVTVSEYKASPYWAVETNEDDYLQEHFAAGMLWTDEVPRTQDIPTLMHPNGAVFGATTDAWEQYERFYTPRTVGYEMPVKRSFDVDEPWELEFVRTLLSS